MSAPPLVDPPSMPTVVSRLPKFGSRPKSSTASDGAQSGPSAAATSTRLTNGFYHHPGPGVNSISAPLSSVKQNGFIRVPTSFSMKWRKENGTMEDGGRDGEKEWRRRKGRNVGQICSSNNIPQYNSQRQQGSPVVTQRDAKKPSTYSAGKGRGYGQQATSSSSPSPQSSPRTLPLPKLRQPGPISVIKQTLNGLSGSRPRSGTNGSLRQPQTFSHPGGSRPGSGSSFRSGSPLQKKPPASRSQSTDSLGSAVSTQLMESDRFRSRSLTQVRQQLSPTLTPSSPCSSSSQTVTRSYSINRAAEPGLREPTAPPTGNFSKSSVSSRIPEGGGKGGVVKGQSSAASGSSGVSIPSRLPPAALKKTLLPGLAPASKPSGISYKLSRPSLIKHSRPLRVSSANGCGGDPEVNQDWRNLAETPSTTDNSPEAPESGGLSAEPESHVEVSVVGETLEDMSLSSTSSLDRNDTSQEYMDDFDNLGNGGISVLLLSSKNDEDDSGLDQSCTRFDDKVSVNGVTKTTGLCFLDDDERGTHHLSQLSDQRRSSQPDYHDQGGSSLDLSPSDSCESGGTYMWDEEGLEPLGGGATTASINTNSNTTHHIGSFDSDLNSIDILNNLDSCDLEDDDLMLDADLAEDASLHSDGDGMSHMAQWRRRQLCWGMQDVHNDNDGDFQCYKLTEDPGNQRTDTTRRDDLILDLCPQRSPCLSPDTPGLGLDVEELAEDCSAVRSQLEFLQKLLLQEEEVDDDTLTTGAVSPEAYDSSHSSHSQMQTLLQEVQQLREELRNRDRTIAQLTLKLTVPMTTTRCCCQETTGRTDQHTQTSVTEKESVASQTPWRDHTSQILHASSQEHQEPLTDQIPAPLQASANCCSTSPEIPSDGRPDHPHTNITNSTAQGDEGGRRQQKVEEKSKTKERKGTLSRSLPLPQPSKLHLFLSQASKPGCSSAATILSKTTTSRQLSSDSDSNGTSGVKLKSLGFSSSSSRLPKPKSY